MGFGAGIGGPSPDGTTILRLVSAVSGAGPPIPAYGAKPGSHVPLPWSFFTLGRNWRPEVGEVAFSGAMRLKRQPRWSRARS